MWRPRRKNKDPEGGGNRHTGGQYNTGVGVTVRGVDASVRVAGRLILRWVRLVLSSHSQTIEEAHVFAKDTYGGKRKVET